ncbi:TonB-dependent receptor domain-containing protein [Arhodomonas sp. SL1]|uniref:TonB-dependent receptor domain-containing protein n=1 Tax=Arhodomonas sp. SL1 TaxID=3425691 RepID=UPI003F884079
MRVYRLRFTATTMSSVLALLASTCAHGEVTTSAAVVVSATRTEQQVSTAPASVSVVSGEELRNVPSDDLTDAVRQLPGISLSAGSQGRSEISIRGMDSDYTLILVDGKRVNSREAVFRHNDYDLGMIPVDAIDRVEVIRGGMSALYGSEALGGVVNIITKPAERTWGGSINAEAAKPTEGRDGLERNTSLRVSGPLVRDHLAFTVTAAYSRREPWRAGDDRVLTGGDGDPVTRGDGSVVKESDLGTVEGRDNRDVGARLSWTPAEGQTVKAEIGHREQERFGEYFIRGWGEADQELVRDDLSLSHQGRWSWGDSEFRAYGERIETDSDGVTQTNRLIEGNATAYLGNHALTAGAELWRLELEDAPGLGGAGTPGDDRVRQAAVYLQDDIMLTDQLDLLLGARVDDHERFGTEVTPRGYLVYRLSPRVTVKGGVATGFKAPTLRQNSPTSQTASCRGACTLVGNPDLEPETSTNYEASVAYDGGAWNSSLTFFRNDVEDLIERDLEHAVGSDEDGNPYYTYVNVAEARLQGVEATLRRTLTQSLTLTANYTYLDAEDRETGETLTYRPKHSANVRLEGELGMETRWFVRTEYRGEQSDGETTLSGYALTDAGMSHDLSDTLTVRGGVLNIADQRTERDDGYSYQERGRTLYAALTARF